MSSMLNIGRQIQLTGLFAQIGCRVTVNLLPTVTNIATGQRNTSFFVKLKGEQLWHGMTSVSNAGKKRGRGRGAKKLVKNLNIGQIIGVGPSNMLWPGLNAPIIKGKEIVERKQLPPDPEFQAKLNKLRDQAGGRFRSLSISPLERGWSGTKVQGRSIGAPDTIGEEKFEGFQTKVLEFKQVANMTAAFGRRRRHSAFAVTGNYNGTVGFALAKSPSGKAALKRVKNLAGQRLMYIERFDNHTIYHDFFTQFGTTKLFVKKKPEGHGLVCHRVLKCICEVIGIKNLYAKVEGRAKNTQNLTKAFFMGLLNQKTHQKLAEQQKLYVVEFKEENGNFPRVVAAPSVCLTEEELHNKTVPDYNEVISEGKLELVRPKRPKYYTQLPGWQVHLRKTQRFRNHYDYKVKTVAELGDLTSFVWKHERAGEGPPAEPYNLHDHVYKRTFHQLPPGVKTW